VSVRTVVPRGPFSLAQSVRFAAGFAPDPHPADATSGHLHLAFVPDGGRDAVAACVRAARGADDDAIEVELAGDGDHERAHLQVLRILSLDVDATEFAAVGDRDPVVAGLRQLHPGLRPVGFLSPFEAGVWFLLGQRIRMTQAAALKAQLRDALGQTVAVCGESLVAFPSPHALAEAPASAFTGIPDINGERVVALARAAIDGILDGERLRALDPQDALAELLELPGVGPFTAQGIVLRGAGAPDMLASAEPRLGRAVARAYGLRAEPSADALARIAEPWRPFRSWVTVLLRVELERGAAA
jgi:DNA-3-methyladenine glycosylase II